MALQNDISALQDLPRTPGDLTYEQVRDMLVLVRRIKTKLEVIWAEKEGERG